MQITWGWGRSKSLELDQLAKDLWGWSNPREIWVSSVHTPGISKKEKKDAGEQSRHFNDKCEWALNTWVFQEITAEYPEFNKVLFATRAKQKFDTYCSWKPEPGCSFVDAFTLNWHTFNLRLRNVIFEWFQRWCRHCVFITTITKLLSLSLLLTCPKIPKKGANVPIKAKRGLK